MKIKANIIIIVSIIVVLLGSIILLSLFTGNSGEGETPAKAQSVQIINALSDESSGKKSFTVTKEEESYTVVYNAGLWQVLEKENINLDQEYVKKLFDTVCTLSAVPLEEGSTDLSKFGLADPSTVFEFSNSSDKVYTINLGIKVPTESGYYITVDNKPDVYILSSDIYDMLNGDINSLRNKQILEIASEDVYGVTIKNPKDTITILPQEDSVVNAHSNTIWKMTTPYEMDVNQNIFEENIINVLDFTVTEFVDYNPSDYSIYGLDNPKYSVTFDTYAGPYTILLGNDKDAELIYMKLADTPNVYAISKELVKYRDFTPVYLMESLVFSRMIINVDNIVFNADKSYVMKIEDENFTVNDKSVEEDSFRAAYLTLISSVIAGEIDAEIGNEICNFTFNYNNGTAPETVTFYEYGDMYAAVNVNGTMNFYVMRSYVDDMINSVKKLAE